MSIDIKHTRCTAHSPDHKVIRQAHQDKGIYIYYDECGKKQMNPNKFFSEELNITSASGKVFSKKSGKKSALTNLVNNTNLPLEQIAQQSTANSA